MKGCFGFNPESVLLMALGTALGYLLGDAVAGFFVTGTVVLAASLLIR